MEPINKNMKYKKLQVFISCSLIILFSLTILGCIGEKVICYEKPLYREGIKMNNLYQALNYKDTFNLGDTLWIQLSVPIMFIRDGKSCSLLGNDIAIRNNCFIYYDNDSVYDVISNPQYHHTNIISAISNNSGSLKKVADYYVGKYGIILDNHDISIIGDTTLYYYNNDSEKFINIYSISDNYCTYKDPACGKNKSYIYGFILHTTFQNNQPFLPIHIR